jgi:tRNA A-37 threonylcarbamoyl transferase component Bud32
LNFNINTMYRKEFPATPRPDIVREVRLQTTAANLGLAPRVLGTDNKTFIEMENVGTALAYVYGTDTEDLPNDVRGSVYDIICTLYANGIQYLDITPYNFTQDENGRVWIIDFGHATNRKRLRPYLIKMFNEGYLHTWNADFR